MYKSVKGCRIPSETSLLITHLIIRRWTFTNDPQYFPTEKMQEIVNYLHSHDQQYSALPSPSRVLMQTLTLCATYLLHPTSLCLVLMIDPAVAHQPQQNYTAYDVGTEMDVFVKCSSKTYYAGPRALK